MMAASSNIRVCTTEVKTGCITCKNVTFWQHILAVAIEVDERDINATKAGLLTTGAQYRVKRVTATLSLMQTLMLSAMVPGNRSASHSLDGLNSVRLRSADLVEKYLSTNDNTLVSAVKGPQCSYPSPTFSLLSNETGIPRTFQTIANSGKLSSRGVDFLANIDHLGRPYIPAFKDLLATLLALRMIESLNPTLYPAHALVTEEANTM